MALIRNSREGNYPDPLEFARICIGAGAAGITVHPRPDQRHIRPSDVRNIAKLLIDNSEVEFNIEGNPQAPAREEYPGLLGLVNETRPAQCTLVPDSDQQKTSDHGFDLTRDFDVLHPMVKQIKDWGVRVSLFMDPIPEQIRLAAKLGADRIELYTGPFAWAFKEDPSRAKTIFEQHCQAARLAADLGLGVNAGHDLNLDNMRLYRSLPALQEVSIGHALTVDALLMGFDNTIKAYLAVCS